MSDNRSCSSCSVALPMYEFKVIIISKEGQATYLCEACSDTLGYQELPIDE